MAQYFTGEMCMFLADVKKCQF